MISLSDSTVACKHLGRFFKLCVEYNLEKIDFTMKALNSDYKKGIEKYKPQWYSQSEYYYFEEFLEENIIEKYIYEEKERIYNEEVMYWLGYCLQEWSNAKQLKGEDIARLYGEDGIRHLIKNYKVYHTVDPLYVLEDTLDIHGISI